MEIINNQSSDEKMWAMLCHLSALAGLIIPFGGIIAPLIIWSVKKEEYPFVNDQGKESLNFQISMLIYTIICAILVFIFIGIFLLIFMGVIDLVLIIIAAVKTNSGERFRYPFSLRIIE